MLHKAWSSIEEVPYCFWRSSIKFQGHSAKKNRWFWPKLGVSRLKNRRFESNLSKITRPVAAIKSLRFALLNCNLEHMLCLIFMATSSDNAFRRMSQDIFNDKLTLVQVMAWCHQAWSCMKNHYVIPLPVGAELNHTYHIFPLLIGIWCLINSLGVFSNLF